MWDILRRLIPSNKKCSSVVEDNDKSKSKANSFNDFFANVGKETYERSQPNTIDLNDDLSLNLDTDTLT